MLTKNIAEIIKFQSQPVQLSGILQSPLVKKKNTFNAWSTKSGGEGELLKFKPGFPSLDTYMYKHFIPLSHAGSDGGA